MYEDIVRALLADCQRVDADLEAIAAALLRAYDLHFSFKLEFCLADVDACQGQIADVAARLAELVRTKGEDE